MNKSALAILLSTSVSAQVTISGGVSSYPYNYGGNYGGYGGYGGYNGYNSYPGTYGGYPTSYPTYSSAPVSYAAPAPV